MIKVNSLPCQHRTETSLSQETDNTRTYSIVYGQWFKFYVKS